MKNIFYITYVFPPTGGAGIQRNVKFIKYLFRIGWNITVITPKNPSVPTKDTSFSEDIPKGIRIVYTRTFEPGYSVKSSIHKGVVETATGFLGRWKNRVIGAIKPLAQSILVPDAQILWTIPSLWTAISVAKREKADVIFVSAPPFSSLLFASWVSRITGVPYVVDFRDEWTDFYEKQFDSHRRILGRGIITRLERSIVKNAAAVTMATYSYVENMRRKYPEKADAIHVITNGFDPEDFGNDVPSPMTGPPKRLNISYFGTLFNVTTARYFLEAVQSYLNKNQDARSELGIHFVGRITEEENGQIDGISKELSVTRHGYIDHAEVMPMMRMADVLLVIVDSLPGAERIIAGKIFEYAYSGRFILALVPQGGEVDRLVRDTGHGISCAPRDCGAIEQALETIFSKWRDGSLNKVARSGKTNDAVSKYSREALAKQLSVILESVSKKGGL